MRMNKRTMAIVGGGFIGVLVLITVAFMVMQMLAGDPEPPPVQATPAPAATAAPAPTVEPTPTAETSSFEMRESAPSAQTQGQQQAAAPQPPPAPVSAPGAPAVPQDWTPGFQTPVAAFSSQESFSGPGMSGTPVAMAETPVAMMPAETPVSFPGMISGIVSPVSTVVPAPEMADDKPVVIEREQPETEGRDFPPHATDLVGLSQILFSTHDIYEMRGVVDYRLMSEKGEVHIPIHIHVKEIRPDRHVSTWQFDPFDESFVDSFEFELIRIGDRLFVDSDQDVATFFGASDVSLEFRLCAVLLCSSGQSVFSEASYMESSESEVRVHVHQNVFGDPFEFLSGRSIDVVYTIDAASGDLQAVRFSADVPFSVDGSATGLSVDANFDVIYDSVVQIVDPEDPSDNIGAGSPSFVPTAVVVETPAAVVSELPSPVPTEVAALPSPVATVTADVPAAVATAVPLVEVISDPESDTSLVRVVSQGYQAVLPNEWFVYDSSVFGDLLASRIEDGLRELFAVEPRPHLVGLDAFDASPYVAFSQHAALDEDIGIDTFSHLEFSRQTEHKLLVNRGWGVSILENQQGYRGRMYRYETTRDTLEWMVFFQREHDVIQFLMEADPVDGEGLDYDRVFRDLVANIRFGDSIGDDGSRPVMIERTGVDLQALDLPRVVNLSYSGNTILVSFSEPVWVSSADGVFVRVMLLGNAPCEHPCDGSDGSLEFTIPGLMAEYVTRGFWFSEQDGSIRDIDGNAVQHDFTPYTEADHPVVVGVQAELVEGPGMSASDVFEVRFSEPVWVADGDMYMVVSGNRIVPCVDCPVSSGLASSSLLFGWPEAADVLSDAPRAGDVIFRLEGSGRVLGVGNVAASVELEPVEIVSR